MASTLSNEQYYDNLGGVNKKVSEYKLTRTEFLNLRNVDFDVPNALQKRPGSTQAVSVNTSGPIIGMFEFTRLSGSSWVVFGSNTALFKLASSNYSLIDSGWSNGQPQDMLTFVNKLWITDGGRYKWWDGGESFGIQKAGLPMQNTYLDLANWWQQGQTAFSYDTSNGSTGFLVAGASMVTRGSSYIARGVYVAYSYIRTDGYLGPADFLSNAKNIVRTLPTSTGDEFFGFSNGANFPGQQILTGFSIPTGYGITAVQMWMATDSVGIGSNQEYIENAYFSGTTPISRQVAVGNLGWDFPFGGAQHHFMSVTLKPGADLSLFRLYTTIPVNNLYTVRPVDYAGLTISAYGITAAPFGPNGGGLTFAAWENGTVNTSFSGMVFNFWDTYIPKYIEVNQNVMFMAGFSVAPSQLWYSDLGEPENIQPESNFEVRTNDGDRIIGIKAYNDTLLVFKTASFHKLIGSNADNFQLVQLSYEFGCVSNKAIIEYNEKLLFLDRKGIVQYDGAGWRVISNNIDEVFRGMNLTAAYEKAIGIHYQYRNQIWFGIPTGNSTENNLTVVWDYLVDAWTFFDGFNPSAFSYSFGALNRPTVWRGSYSGMVYYHSETFFGDNGQGITCLGLSRFDKFQGENSTSIWRRLFLDVSTASGITGVISGRVFSDYDQSTVKATFTMYQTQFQNRAEMGVVGKAMSFEFAHNSASLPFLMNGYTWAKRFLRDV